MISPQKVPLFSRFLTSGHGIPGSIKAILRKFFSLSSLDGKSVEVSSDSTQGRGKNYLRVTFFGLDRKDCLQLLPRNGFLGSEAGDLLFSNSKEPCFALGISHYHRCRDENRIKLYNFYHLASNTVHPREHIEAVCRYGGIAYAGVASDLDLLKKIPFTSVDIYENGQIGLKMYSERYLSKDLFGEYRKLFDTRVLARYDKFFRSGCLPKVFSFCFRYVGALRSVRTDFLCNTSQISPYFDMFDVAGAAQQLYLSLLAMKMSVKLTYLGVDLDKRPRIQFNFSVS